MAFYPISSNDLFDIIMHLHELMDDCYEKMDEYYAGYYSACADFRQMLFNLMSKYSQ